MTVLFAGRAIVLVDGVRAALAAASRQAVDWRLLIAQGTAQPPLTGPGSVDIAVCDGAGTIRMLRGRWPAATVVALVPARDDGTGTVVALHAGADVSIRGDDTGLVAAYLQSVARRRSLLEHGVPR